MLSSITVTGCPGLSPTSALLSITGVWCFSFPPLSALMNHQDSVSGDVCVCVCHTECAVRKVTLCDLHVEALYLCPHELQYIYSVVCAEMCVLSVSYGCKLALASLPK